MKENLFKQNFVNILEFSKNLKLKIKGFFRSIGDNLTEDLFVNGYHQNYMEGISMYGRGRYDKAIYYFEKANEEKPNVFNCLYNLALSYQANKQYEQAIAMYQKAQEITPNDYDTIYNLGLCYLNAHEGEFAEEYLFNALQKNPKDSSAKMNYILALVENEKIDQAIQETITIVRSNKTFLDFTLTVAKHIEDVSIGVDGYNNMMKAIKLLNSYLKVNQTNSSAFLQISLCYGKLGNWDLALRHSLKALELQPKSYEINSHTGLVLYYNHNYEKALEYYEKALLLSEPNNFDIHLNIALTYEKLGYTEDAMKKTEYILKVFKDNERIQEAKNLMDNLENGRPMIDETFTTQPPETT